MAWLLITLTCLTVYRVTRLLVSDKILESPRIKLYSWLCTRDMSRSDYASEGDYLSERSARLSNIANRVRREPLSAYFLTCPWCTSIWIGAFIVGVLWLTTDIPYPLLVWPASSAITGLLATKED